MLDGTVDVPAVGRVKKRYVVIPAALAAAYIGFRWYQARSGADEPAPGADGYYTSDDLSEYGLSTTGGSTTVGGNTGNTVTDGTKPDAIDDNAEWTQAAVERLGNAGYDAAVVYGALGEFLARRALDKTEATIARAAIAAAGQPPVGGPYSVIEEAATGTGTLPAPTGLKVTATSPNSITLSWNKVDGAAYYDILRSDTGANAVRSNDTNGTILGLQPNTEYTFQVRAVGSTNKPGPSSSAVKGKTKALTLAKPTNLRASAITKNSFRVTCNTVAGAQYYLWTLDGKSIGPTQVPYRDFTGLRAGTRHTVTVRADTVTQSPGPVSAPLTVTTKK